MYDSIRIKPGREAASHALLRDSALAGCAAVDSFDAQVIALNWPGISSGERLLWRVMGWLNEVEDDAPSVAELAAGLDSFNLAVAEHAISGGAS